MFARQSSFAVFLTIILVFFTFLSIAKAQNFLYPMEEVRKDLREAAMQAFDRMTTLTPNDAFTALQRLKMVGEAYFKNADPDLAKELAKRGGIQFVVSIALDICIDVLIKEMVEREEFSKWGVGKDLVELWAKSVKSGLIGGPGAAAISAAHVVHNSWKETEQAIKALPPDAPMDANLRYLYEIITGAELMKKEKPYLKPILSFSVEVAGITLAVAEQAKIFGLHRLTTGILPLTEIKPPSDASQLSQRIVGYVNKLDNAPPQLTDALISKTGNSLIFSYIFNEPMGPSVHVRTSGFCGPEGCTGTWSDSWSSNRKVLTTTVTPTPGNYISPSGSVVNWTINPDPNIPPQSKLSDLSGNPAPTQSGSFVVP